MAEGKAAFLEMAGDVIAALDDIPSPAALLDETGTIRWQNQASLDLRGQRVGARLGEFVAPGDREQAHAVFERVLREGVREELVVHALTSKGKFVTFQGRWNAISLRDGRQAVVALNLGDVVDLPHPGAAERAPLLTRRQLQVLRMLAAGNTTDEIASELSLSPTTIRNHVANTLAVLDVHSRLQAVAAARQAGLLTAENE